ncbi:hypothetical protein AB0M48_12445 [Lentzea sp. NPDC051208]|uniref:hypothetical protein n=1 Tax=Lentzea sp. NPDC051208 TaxID=3154642 RepID=UPI003414A688
MSKYFDLALPSTRGDGQALGHDGTTGELDVGSHPVGVDLQPLGQFHGGEAAVAGQAQGFS